MKKTPLWLAAAFLFIGGLEGTRYVAYPDVIGVWSICQGETLNVHEGDTATKEQCDAKLYARILQFDAELSRCLPDNYKTPGTRRVAFVSLAYNCGSAAVCNSSIPQKLRAGNVAAACETILDFNRVCVERTADGKCVKKKAIQGLTNRRIKERELCLQDAK